MSITYYAHVFISHPTRSVYILHEATHLHQVRHQNFIFSFSAIIKFFLNIFHHMKYL